MTKEEMERVKRTVARKYPIFANQILLNIPVVEDKRIETAAVRAEENEKGELEPKLIKYNPEFMDNLSFEQQCFVLAHEICHVAFLHFLRSIHKPKQDAERKYAEYCSSVADEKLRKIKKIELENKCYKIWNTATDACINVVMNHLQLYFCDNNYIYNYVLYF
jgi:predicted metal-dependent peptidase